MPDWTIVSAAMADNLEWFSISTSLEHDAPKISEFKIDLMSSGGSSMILKTDPSKDCSLAIHAKQSAVAFPSRCTCCSWRAQNPCASSLQ